MTHYKMSDVAVEVNDRENNPASSKYDRFVGLEHYVSGEVIIRNYGSTENLESTMKIFQSGDVLVARRNVYLKRASMVDFDGLTSGDSIVLRAKNPVIGRILPFVLNTDAFWDFADQYSDGTMSKRLSPKTLMTYEFDLPDEDELEKFADLLWAANDTRESYQALLRQTDELVKSQFIELFESAEKSFPECTIIEACANKDDIKCGPFGTQLKQSEYTESGVAVWGIPEINKEFQKAPEIFITPDKANQLSPYSLIPGDIAMSRKGNVGQCAIYPESFEPGIIASDVLRIRIDKTKLVPLFMQYQLHHSERVKNQVLQVSNGAVMAGINVTKLKGIVIYIPPIRLQKKFADFVQQTDKSKYYEQNRIFSVTRGGELCA